MSGCAACGGPAAKEHSCDHCKEIFCTKHLPANEHDCPEVPHYQIGQVDTDGEEDGADQDQDKHEAKTGERPSFEAQEQAFAEQEPKRRSTDGIAWSVLGLRLRFLATRVMQLAGFAIIIYGAFRIWIAATDARTVAATTDVSGQEYLAATDPLSVGFVFVGMLVVLATTRM